MAEGDIIKLCEQGIHTNLITNAGRFYFYVDKRWVTDSDDLYGVNYYQMAESGGAGAEPITEWEHQGIMIPAGRTISKLHFTGRVNNVEVTDFEIHAILRFPNTPDIWETGLNSDAEDTDIVLHRDNFYTPNDPDAPVFTNAISHVHKRTIHIDQAVEQDSFLSIYLKPIGTITATRYLYANYTWELI